MEFFDESPIELVIAEYVTISACFLAGIVISFIAIHMFRYRIYWFLRWLFDRLWAWVSFPLAMFHVKLIQWQYKRITIKHGGSNRSNRNLARLRLLQAKEEYYKSQFGPYGRYHPSCVISDEYKAFLNKLFPEKNFQEWELIIWNKKDAITFYRNEIHKLRGSYPSGDEIVHQIKIWEKERRKLRNES